MAELDLLDPKHSFFFYEGRVTKVEGVESYGKVGEVYSTIVVGRVRVQEVHVEAFVAGEPPFVVRGDLLRMFVEIAGPVVSEIYDGRYRRSYRFAILGARSIELVSDRVGFECSSETYFLPDELLDQRERLVTVLNEAVERMLAFV